MSDLNFQIFTDNGVVPVPVFKGAVDNAIFLLNQVDIGLSERTSSVLNWYVDGLETSGDGNGNGPRNLSIHFFSEVRKHIRKPQDLPYDFAPKVAEEFVDGLNDIETKCETPKFLPENGMERVRKMSQLLENEVTAFRFTAKDHTASITPQAAKNVERLIGKSKTALASISGRLEGMNVHKGLKGLLYHSVTNKVITCEFHVDRIKEVTKAFGKKVVVTGEVYKNIKGETIRIIDPKLEIVEGKPRFSYQRAKQSSLVTPTFADTLSTAEYMRRIRGD